MTVAGRDADERIRTILQVIPTLLRADRPTSAALHQMTELARSLLGARYASMALLRADGSFGATSFTGAVPEEARAIGGPPVSRRLFDELQAAGAALRVDSVDAPDALGLPPGHPPIGSFLGTCLKADNRVMGVIYVADREGGGAFTDEDEQLLCLLAGALGSAISSRNLLRDAINARRWARAANAMTRDLFAEDLDEPLRFISDRARELADADVVALLMFEDSVTTVRYVRGLLADTEVVGLAFRTGLGSWVSRVRDSGRPEMLSDVGSEATAAFRRIGGGRLGPSMLLPLHGAGGVHGALFLSREAGSPPFTESDLETAAGFADHAAVTRELAAGREAAERVRLLEERNRIARDLHDHVVQRLFATGLSLHQVIPQVQDKVKERVETAVVTLDETIRQIRNTILTLRSADDGATLERLVTAIAREATPLLGFPPLVALEAPSGEIGGDLAADLAACIREGVSNTIRHAKATSLEIRATVVLPNLLLTLRDDGQGIHSDRRSGLENLRERVARHHGTFHVTSPPEGGTVLTWRVPLPTDR